MTTPAMQPTSSASSYRLRDALLVAKKALLSAEYAMKGREHTGFIATAIAEIDGSLASQATVPPVVQAPIEPVQIRLNEQEAGALRDVIGDNRSITQAMTLKIGDGHSGFGLYAWSTEYPEDGSWFIKSVAAPIVATVPSEPPDVSELRRFACFEIEDGIYEHPFGSYVLFRDVVDLIKQAYAAPSTAEQASDVRNAALEEAAVTCEQELCTCCWGSEGHAAADYLAEAIRKLKSATPADKGNAPGGVKP